MRVVLQGRHLKLQAAPRRVLRKNEPENAKQMIVEAMIITHHPNDQALQ
jgi:hypothetical protein